MQVSSVVSEIYNNNFHGELYVPILQALSLISIRSAAYRPVHYYRGLNISMLCALQANVGRQV